MKKFLSLVMTLAMAVSLFAFAAPGAGAKNDFTDLESISSNKAMLEAIDVVKAIEVMDGNSATTFNPTGGLTRQAAAKIICNMILGPTTAKALPTNQNPFPDVAAGTEFAGYIAYCAENGIINGYADGTFRPTDPLSGYAFLKMLLGALRYDAVTEGYVGTNWRVNVAKRALGIGLDIGLGKDLEGAGPINRSEAALFVCNTLKADLIEYDTDTTTIIIQNATDASKAAEVTTGNKGTAKAVSWENSRTYAGNIAPETQFRNRNNYIQFAEQYFNRLIMRTTTEGDFGRPARRWTWKGVEIGTYPSTPDKIYYGDVNFNDIYTDLNMSGDDVRGIVFMNGVRMNGFATDAAGNVLFDTSGNPIVTNDEDGIARGDVAIRRSNDQSLNNYDKAQCQNAGYVALLGGWGGANQAANLNNVAQNGRVGDGTIVECYRNDDINAVTICIISVYPGQVTNVNKATSTKDAYVVIEGYDRNNQGMTIPEGSRAVFHANDRDELETTSFAEDDIVWFTYSDNNRAIVDATKMTSTEGRLTKRVVNKSLTVGGTTYKYGKNYAFDDNFSEDELDYDEDYIVYMDSQGYALWIEPASFAAGNYALLTRITSEFTDTQNRVHTLTGIEPIYNAANPATDTWNGNRAHLVFADGTERNVDLDDDYIVTIGTGANQIIRIDEDFSLNQTLKIVRYRQLDDGTYRLYAVKNQLAQFYTDNDGFTEPTQLASERRYINPNDALATLTPSQFRIENKEATVTQLTKNLDTGVFTWDSATTDSKTIFVVKDGSSYKVYTGVRNAPTVKGNNAAAYCYYTGAVNSRVAKLVYVTNGNIENNSKNITFIAAKSASGLITSTDTKKPNYREFNAVVNGEITTILISTATNINSPAGTTLLVQTASADYEQVNNVIVNNTSYDKDDIMNAGSWSSASLTNRVLVGVKRVTGSSYLIQLGGSEYEVSKDCNMFFVNDDGDIERIANVNEFSTDSNDLAFFTYDVDDGVITNLFICEVGNDGALVDTEGTLQNLQFTIGSDPNKSAVQDIDITNARYPARAIEGNDYGSFTASNRLRIRYAVTLPGNTPDQTEINLVPGATTNNGDAIDPNHTTWKTYLNNGYGKTTVGVTAEDGQVVTYEVHFYRAQDDDSSLKTLKITGATINDVDVDVKDQTIYTQEFNGANLTASCTYNVVITGNSDVNPPAVGDILNLNIETSDEFATISNVAPITLQLAADGETLEGSTQFTVTSYEGLFYAQGHDTIYTVYVHT